MLLTMLLNAKHSGINIFKFINSYFENYTKKIKKQIFIPKFVLPDIHFKLMFFHKKISENLVVCILVYFIYNNRRYFK